MFDLVIESKLRGFDLAKIRIAISSVGGGSAAGPLSSSEKPADPFSSSFLNLPVRAFLLGSRVGVARSTTSRSRAGSTTLLTPGQQPLTRACPGHRCGSQQ
jgi:hypothetical protein